MWSAQRNGGGSSCRSHAAVRVHWCTLTGQGGTNVQWDGPGYKGQKFAKVALIPKVGTPFTLQVPPEMRGHMKIGWSHSGYTLAGSLAIPGCTTSEPDV